MSDPIWFQDPSILIKKPLEIFPIGWKGLVSKESKFNSITRLVIIVFILIILTTSTNRGMWIIILILILVMMAIIWETNLYSIQRMVDRSSEEFDETRQNPLYSGRIRPDNILSFHRSKSTADDIAQMLLYHQPKHEKELLSPFGPPRSRYASFYDRNDLGNVRSELWQRGKNSTHVDRLTDVEYIYPKNDDIFPCRKMNLGRVI